MYNELSRKGAFRGRNRKEKNTLVDTVVQRAIKLRAPTKAAPHPRPDMRALVMAQRGAALRVPDALPGEVDVVAPPQIVTRARAITSAPSLQHRPEGRKRDEAAANLPETIDDEEEEEEDEEEAKDTMNESSDIAWQSTADGHAGSRHNEPRSRVRTSQFMQALRVLVFPSADDSALLEAENAITAEVKKQSGDKAIALPTPQMQAERRQTKRNHSSYEFLKAQRALSSTAEQLESTAEEGDAGVDLKTAGGGSPDAWGSTTSASQSTRWSPGVSHQGERMTRRPVNSSSKFHSLNIPQTYDEDGLRFCGEKSGQGTSSTSNVGAQRVFCLPSEGNFNMAAIDPAPVPFEEAGDWVARMKLQRRKMPGDKASSDDDPVIGAKHRSAKKRHDSLHSELWLDPRDVAKNPIKPLRTQFKRKGPYALPPALESGGVADSSAPRSANDVHSPTLWSTDELHTPAFRSANEVHTSRGGGSTTTSITSPGARAVAPTDPSATGGGSATHKVQSKGPPSTTASVAGGDGSRPATNHPLVERYRQLPLHGKVAQPITRHIANASYKDCYKECQLTMLQSQRPGSRSPSNRFADDEMLRAHAFATSPGPTPSVSSKIYWRPIPASTAQPSKSELKQDGNTVCPHELPFRSDAHTPVDMQMTSGGCGLHRVVGSGSATLLFPAFKPSSPLASAHGKPTLGRTNRFPPSSMSQKGVRKDHLSNGRDQPGSSSKPRPMVMVNKSHSGAIARPQSAQAAFHHS